MPHVVVKMFAGRTDAQKQRIAEAVTRVVMDTASCSEDSVSVAIEDVAPGDWDEKVFAPDIAAKAATLYKKPGYKPV